ncbi:MULTISPECIES: homogentisate 1,2-dioxygenase [unclassified Aeromicrobium]|uniref:homogentisate 1,2-dioxygenase n=1 Tax=unclassified Aeromicrobium TaxID=2633570 RepID=UPI0006FD0750|nr:MULTISPECIES: cupin domain-containing protein [unclassified Aeromicrobium]KQO42102.1 homogentisate 1,2-dioxygenase [Aeromicrobium sp. Leaf245]KQP75639.1 homogentisate 1,2-dioxygenase [Aeromicrobium sp. Leaf289]KQP81472.1 homogentisate 1,2-dioxygenase [Aeromicrobium sp. Leaf291]
MAHYRRAGSIPPKRHTQHRSPDGTLYREELMGEEGFSSDSSLLYHVGVPSAVLEARRWELPDQTTTPNEPLLPRHLRLHDLFDEGGTDVVQGRRLVLGNADVRISYVVADATSPLYRNATGDEIVFVEAGTGVLETVLGHLTYGPGDYLVVPRATTHRYVVETTTRAYCIEANGHVAPPKRYLSRYGQLLEHAPYCERDLRGPGEPEVREEGPVEVFIKHRGSGPGGLAGTVHVVPDHPFDVVGWDGCLYPYALSVHDFEPITGRIHQPPPVHQVFEGSNFVVCNFVPRKVDYHPLAIPVPYFHANVDSDEIMFYVDGDYEARKGSGIAKGSVTVHPGGHSHGPQPAAIEASLGAESFDELAVMVDTFRPLELGEGGRAVDDGVYHRSWSQ